MTIGDFDGDADGDFDGALVGCVDGAFVGCDVGTLVGAAVGRFVVDIGGATLGFVDGVFVGGVGEYALQSVERRAPPPTSKLPTAVTPAQYVADPCLPLFVSR